MRHDIPMGGGNLPAILVTGTLMFLFYGIGWSIPGTIFLFAFLIVGYDSLFPIIALSLWALFYCFHHFNDGAVIFALVFWIVILLSWEACARVLIAEEKNGNSSSRKGK